MADQQGQDQLDRMCDWHTVALEFDNLNAAFDRILERLEKMGDGPRQLAEMVRGARMTTMLAMRTAWMECAKQGFKADEIFAFVKPEEVPL